MTATDPIIDLVQEELDAYRRDRRSVHLIHAARALEEALTAAGSNSQEKSDVGLAQERR